MFDQLFRGLGFAFQLLIRFRLGSVLDVAERLGLLVHQPFQAKGVAQAFRLLAGLLGLAKFRQGANGFGDLLGRAGESTSQPLVRLPHGAASRLRLPREAIPQLLVRSQRLFQFDDQLLLPRRKSWEALWLICWQLVGQLSFTLSQLAERLASRLFPLTFLAQFVQQGEALLSRSG